MAKAKLIGTGHQERIDKVVSLTEELNNIIETLCKDGITVDVSHQDCTSDNNMAHDNTLYEEWEHTFIEIHMWKSLGRT